MVSPIVLRQIPLAGGGADLHVVQSIVADARNLGELLTRMTEFKAGKDGVGNVFLSRHPGAGLPLGALLDRLEDVVDRVSGDPLLHDATNLSLEMVQALLQLQRGQRSQLGRLVPHEGGFLWTRDCPAGDGALNSLVARFVGIHTGVLHDKVTPKPLSGRFFMQDLPHEIGWGVLAATLLREAVLKEAQAPSPDSRVLTAAFHQLSPKNGFVIPEANLAEEAIIIGEGWVHHDQG